MIKFRFLACALLMGFGQMAAAVTVNSTQTFSGSKSNIFTRSLTPALGAGAINNFGSSLGVFDLAPKFAASKFDPALGTLQSVQITYSGLFDGSNRISVLSFNCSDSGLIDSSCEARSLSIDYTIDFGVFLQIGSTD